MIVFSIIVIFGCVAQARSRSRPPVQMTQARLSVMLFFSLLYIFFVFLLFFFLIIIIFPSDCFPLFLLLAHYNSQNFCDKRITSNVYIIIIIIIIIIMIIIIIIILIITCLNRMTISVIKTAINVGPV